MPSPTDPPSPPPDDLDLDVHGTIPPVLSGQMMGIGRDRVVHSVLVREGRVSYRSRRFPIEAVVHNLVAFGCSVLAFGDDSPARPIPRELRCIWIPATPQ